ncbi:MAG: nitric oxide reductase activation protein [Candidatus Thiodiazotropha sp. (ex Myrtea sp. 'scaly one' KF741663)]|nr:nitric oxide reductase activation protein [Candidatus Thiodiazotropha sp. (ex Myrtea sp. 'scaly one' KF741663)]
MKVRLEKDQIQVLLDDYFEVEFSFRNTADLSLALAQLKSDEQAFVLDWVRRIASTHIEIAYQFTSQASRALHMMDESMIEAWVLQAMDVYDRIGLHAALKVISEIDRFVRQGRERASGALFEEQVGVLMPFVQGLSGRKLKLQQGDDLFTDTETIYLPAVMAHLPDKRDNFLLYKVAVAYHWAQVRFGTFHQSLLRYLTHHKTPDLALGTFHALETERLNACLERELPGLYREMSVLTDKLTGRNVPDGWLEQVAELRKQNASVMDCIKMTESILGQPLPATTCFQGQLNPALAFEVMKQRIEREKVALRVALKAMADELKGESKGEREEPGRFQIRSKDAASQLEDMSIELLINGKSIPMPDDVRGTVTSIIQDLGDVPPEYLVPAGPGEYDFETGQGRLLNPEEVWGGTYHEEGAFFYNEWDYRRKHYRKKWCVMREMTVKPVHDGFADRVTVKYRRLLSHLRKTFEAMRDEDRLLKRQVYGDGVDIDAFVETWADVHTGLEMSERLFTRMHREERNIAVMFMVDMSGSTQGWVNEAEREALVLLAESLEALGDQYAIYGFTGTTRKRCEVFPVKQFDQPYDEAVKARISGIQAGDYTRMGAAIRHLSFRLNEVEARTKLLITLSDGKPDDYQDDYRSEYGIEDTRQSLFEARRSGIHPFCITIDEAGHDYLPHMYGGANYTVISEVEKLPLKVSDIYKKITT